MTAQPIQQQLPDANDVLMGGSSAPTAKFVNPGDTVGGRIVSPPRSHQEREYDRNNPGRGAPKYYPSGDPIMGITVDVQTNIRDAAISDDDGVRRIYVEGKRMKAAIRDAVIASGGQKLEVGGELYVTFSGFGQAENAGINAPKEYTARFVPVAQAAVMGGVPAQPAQQVDTLQSPQAQAPAFAQPTPAATAPAPAAEGPAQPTAAQLAAVRSAGVDPAAAFPHWNGQG